MITSEGFIHCDMNGCDAEVRSRRYLRGKRIPPGWKHAPIGWLCPKHRDCTDIGRDANYPNPRK